MTGTIRPIEHLKLLLHSIGPVLALTSLLSLHVLFENNMTFNEVDVMTSAKHHANPSWIQADWHLNQPSGYRQLFDLLFGPVINACGFLGASLLGRVSCYFLIASGLTLINKRLCLDLPVLMMAVTLFLYVGNEGSTAREWMIGGFEAKAVAYGLVLVAVGFMLQQKYLLMAALLGLATSFHVLVGGWAFSASIASILLRRRRRLSRINELVMIMLVYGISSVFAVKPLLEQLFANISASSIPLSYVYVFLRNPHHLNPLAWQPGRIIKPLIYLTILISSFRFLQRRQFSVKTFQERNAACFWLAEFALLTLVPSIVGLIIVPFDHDGRILQYYLFRFGDVMLPLSAWLLFGKALESFGTVKRRRAVYLTCSILLGVSMGVELAECATNALMLRQFPGPIQGVNSAWKEMSTWIRDRTPKDAIIISPPLRLYNFTWLTERATIAKFKLVPSTPASIREWFDRLGDLSGNPPIWRMETSRKLTTPQIAEALSAGYHSLTTMDVKKLMSKYQADYFLTDSDQRLEMESSHSNSHYILYQFSDWRDGRKGDSQ